MFPYFLSGCIRLASVKLHCFIALDFDDTCRYQLPPEHRCSSDHIDRRCTGAKNQRSSSNGQRCCKGLVPRKGRPQGHGSNFFGQDGHVIIWRIYQMQFFFGFGGSSTSIVVHNN